MNYVNIKKLILLITIFIIQQNESVKGDVYSDLDLLPIKNYVNIIQHKQSRKDNFLLKKKIPGFNETINRKNKLSTLSFSTGENFKYIYDFEIIDTKLNSNLKPNNISEDLYKAKLTLLYPPINFGESKIIRGLSFIYSFEGVNKVLCVETFNSTFGVKKENCEVSGKDFYESSIQNNTEIFSTYKRSMYGIETSLKRLNYNWRTKNALSIKLRSSLIENELHTQENLDKIHTDAFNMLPQRENWINFTLNPKFSNVKQFGENWSIGNSIDIYYVKDLKYKENLKKPSLNYKISSNISKKLTNNVFISLGGYYSKNYKVGFDEFIYTNFNPKLNNNSYTEINLTLGLLKSEKDNKNLSYNQDLINNINYEIKLSNKNKKRQNKLTKNLVIKKQSVLILKTKIKKDNFSKNQNIFNYEKDLKMYALNYAKKFDMNNKILN